MITLQLKSGKLIEGVKIKKAKASLQRSYGYITMAHWIDKETKAPCSVPVERNGIGFYEEI